MRTNSPSGLRYLQLALVALLVIAAQSVVSAQGVLPGSSRGAPSGDGTNAIQGRVLFPPGQAAVQVKVSLEGTAGAFSSTSTATDQDGIFRFRGLAPGSYSVVVDAGSQYEKAREPLTIDPEARSRVSQVVVE